MLKKTLLITALLVSTLWITPMSLAQGVSDCQSTLYGDDFKCTTEKVFSYCSVGLNNSDFNIYGKSYCQTSKNNDDTIFKLVAQQLASEDPKYNDPALIKFILLDIQKSSLQDYLESKYGNRNAVDKLPAVVREEYFEKKGNSGQNAILNRIRVAFNQQKVIYQTKENLKAQFKAKEIWANGNLSDSPFDIVVDLNLIERLLFGNQAQWLNANDVWRWPKNPEEDALKKANSGSTNSNSGGSNSTGTPPAIPKVDEYECKPDAPKDTTSIPLNCGDGQKEPTEACDDGNNQSGDGCSNRCTIEPGADLVCRDIDALNLKTFEPKNPNLSSTGSAKAPSTAPISCPPGTVATKKESPSDSPKQLLNYGGPLLGGVLKQFSPSNKSTCPPGTIPFGFNVAGDSHEACVPNQMCSDPNDVRDLLYSIGKTATMPASWVDLPEEDQFKRTLDAVEASICINIKKVKRPVSPYPITASCIDCHISAMNDSLTILLSKNVTPLQNTMQSFASSNRWGIQASFNLNVTTQSAKNFVFNPKYSGIDAKKIADQSILQDTENPISTLNNVSTSVSNILAKDNEEKTQQTEQFYKSLKNYQFISDASADRNVHGPLMGLLIDLQNSFGRIQANYLQIATSAQFAKKNQCVFK